MPVLPEAIRVVYDETQQHAPAQFASMIARLEQLRRRRRPFSALARAAVLRARCLLRGGHVDELQQSPLGMRLRCQSCERVTRGIPTEGEDMADIRHERMTGFELSQLAAQIGALIHRADAIRGDAPDVAFPLLELPARRHYLRLGEKAIILRPARDQVVGLDQHRLQAKASLRAIQQNRPYCTLRPRAGAKGSVHV